MHRKPRRRLREKFRVARAERKRPRSRRERDLVRKWVGRVSGGMVGARMMGRMREIKE